MDFLRQSLGGDVSIESVPVPFDCIDGFTEAFYGRPERFLDPEVRRAQSAWTFVSKEATERSLTQLHDDLESGKWDEKYGNLRNQATFLGSLTLIVSQNR